MIKSKQPNVSSQTGAILVLVLIVLTSSTLLVMHLFEQNMLSARLLGFLNQQFKEWNQFENHLAPNSNHSVFVPDHLGYGCPSGDWIVEEHNKTMHRIWGLAWSCQPTDCSPASGDFRQ